ncbi:MAG: hypothetical protein KY437_01390 [Actinobacteria bacterium]|nr:hypothetical protein [Actinomycetota bacterium]
MRPTGQADIPPCACEGIIDASPTAETTIAQTFRFQVSPTYAPVLLAWGVTTSRATVEVDERRLRARFGFFRVDTPTANVAEATVRNGPFNALKAIGVRYSFEDGSVTFGSDTGPMLEIRFRQPVTVRPPGLTRHPALWVSVADPDGLRRALEQQP